LNGKAYPATKSKFKVEMKLLKDSINEYTNLMKYMAFFDKSKKILLSFVKHVTVAQWKKMFTNASKIKTE
jgi:hypothetical protein